MNAALETKLDKFNRLVEVSLVINSTLQLEPLLRFIMDAAAEIVESESASILLMDENTRELYFMAFNSDGDEEQLRHLSRIPVPLNNSVAGAAILENRTIVVNDVTTDPRHYRKADDSSGFQTYSLLVIPMRSKDRIIGVLEGVNKLEGEWTKDDEYFLEIMASQAAIAIENAGLVTQLRQANEELSQIDKLKNDFIAIASHELRTPLGVVLGYASFLKEDAQGAASAHATAVLNSAMKMRQIIEDMINLRYLKVGEKELYLEQFPAADIIQLAVHDITSTAKAQEQTIDLDLPPDEVTITVDQSKMVMALTNVMNNAVKFSPPRTRIEVSYQLHADEIWIVVQDEGVGIPEKMMEKIFEEFFQVEDHMTRRHSGMGLGLSIARAVILVHKGRIWASSEGENKGATFYVSLPLG
jgi:K+-sensing histidine kinase KdpD